jgi:hypothetical protein
MSDDQWYPQPGEGVMSWVTRVSAETNRRLGEHCSSSVIRADPPEPYQPSPDEGARRIVESARVPTLPDRWVPLEEARKLLPGQWSLLLHHSVEGVVVPRKALEIARQELQWAVNDLRNNHDPAGKEMDALAAIDAALDTASHFPTRKVDTPSD